MTKGSYLYLFVLLLKKLLKNNKKHFLKALINCVSSCFEFPTLHVVPRHGIVAHNDDPLFWVYHQDFVVPSQLTGSEMSSKSFLKQILNIKVELICNEVVQKKFIVVMQFV